MTETSGTNLEALLALMKTEWADIHHSRIQEWSALGVVTGAQIAMTQIPKFLTETGVILSPCAAATASCLLGIAFAVIGALVTCRHRRLMQIKLNWIYNIELKLGLVKTAENPDGVIPQVAQMPATSVWRGLSWPRFLSTSGLILTFYMLFIIFDLACLLLLMVGK
jgi:hypothetical protein